MSALNIQVAGGLVLLLLVLWQLATGLHWIKLGRTSVKIHRYTGIALAVAGLPHLVNGLMIAGILKF